MTKKEKEEHSRDLMGKFFYDLAKTSFAVLVLTGVVDFLNSQDFSLKSLIVILVGIITTWSLADIANNILEDL